MTQIEILFSVTGIDKLPDMVGKGLVSNVREQIAPPDASDNELPDAVKQALAHVEGAVAARKNVFVEGLVAAYTETFSAEEIEELIAFYRSAIGQRLVTLGGIIVPKVQDLTQTWQSETVNSVQNDFVLALSSMAESVPTAQAGELLDLPQVPTTPQP